ncbi:MAG: ester cyclase [Myxococcota bacterium]
MTTAENRAAYERFCEEVLQRGNLDAIDELVDVDVVSHSPFPGQAPGRAGLKAAFTMFRAAFPALEVEVRDIIAGDDKVVGYFHVSGEQRGEFMGIPPTGKRISYDEMVIVRLRNGKIVEHWSVADTYEMMQSLGVGSNATASDASGGAASTVAERERLERTKMFFLRYAERFNQSLQGKEVDPKEVADSFARHFVEASPIGVNGGKNGLLFRWMIPRGFAHYKKIGATQMNIKKLDVEPLDPGHALAKVEWDSRYAKPDGSEEHIAFDVTYLLHYEHEDPKIFAYITGDEERILREHGIS